MKINSLERDDIMLDDQIKKNNEDTENPIKIIDTSEKVEIDLDDDISEEEIKEEKDDTFKKFINEVKSYIILIAIAFIAAQIIHNFIFTPVSVDGISMEPTLKNADYVLLWRRANYERFDVVVFKATEEDYYIKRLIGLPGDYVRYENETLYINGEAVPEPFLEQGKQELSYKGNFSPDFTLEGLCDITIPKVNCNVNGEVKIPEGYFLVLGDNRPNSKDSTELGLIEQKRFIGEAKYVLFPFSRVKKI